MNPPIWYLGKQNIDEILFAADFLRAHPMACIHGQLYTADGIVEDEDIIRQYILQMIAPVITTGLANCISSLLASLKLQCYSEPFPIEIDRIHVSNGTYYLDGHYSPERHICINRLPVAYNPASPQPEKWLRFLYALLEEDDIPTLQEYMGYCMIPSTKGQKMLLIIGRGGEGKSRIGLVMRALLGNNMNVASLSKIAANRFALANLESELLVIDDDLSLEQLPSTHVIKTLVTAESKMDMERKGQQSYQGLLYARLICFGNGALSAINDRSDGFYRRQIVLTTKDRPEDRVDDPFITEKLIAEIEGIFLWSLEGLHRLIANNYHFTLSHRAITNVEALKSRTNNIVDFWRSEGYIHFAPEAKASSKSLYDAYRQWCRDNVQPPNLPTI